MRYSAVALAAVLVETAVASHGNEWACYAGPWKPEGEDTTPATTIPFPKYPGWGSSGVAVPTGSVIVSTATESSTTMTTTNTTTTATSTPSGKVPVGPSGSSKPTWKIVPGWGWSNASDPGVAASSGGVAAPSGTGVAPGTGIVAPLSTGIIAPLSTGSSDPTTSVVPVPTSVADPATSGVAAPTGGYAAPSGYAPYGNSSGHAFPSGGYAKPSGKPSWTVSPGWSWSNSTNTTGGYAQASGTGSAKPTGWKITPGWSWSNSTSNVTDPAVNATVPAMNTTTPILNTTAPVDPSNTTAPVDPSVPANTTAPVTSPVAPFANSTSNHTGGYAQPSGTGSGKPSWTVTPGWTWNSTNTTGGYAQASGTGSAKPTGWVVTPGWSWGNGTNHTTTSFNGTKTSNFTDPATNVTVPLTTGTSSVAPFSNTTTCFQNNCYRDVLAGAFPNRPTAADCSSFLIATVTAAPTTTTTTETLTATEISTLFTDVTTTMDLSETITVTTTITLATTVATDVVLTTSTMPYGAGIFKRQATATIPAYATDNCLGSAAYASACSCALGITPGTTTVKAPMVTETATLTTTTSITTVETNTITVEATLSFTATAQATTFTPTTVTVTSTVFVSAPTCATFLLQAVAGPNAGSYVQIVDTLDGFDDYAATFNPDITQASTLSWASDTGYISDVATGRYANSDNTPGLTLTSVYFNTADEISSAPLFLSYLSCTSDGTSFDCESPSGNTFFTSSNDDGVLIGAPAQTDPTVNELQVAVIGYTPGACPVTAPALTLTPKH